MVQEKENKGKQIHGYLSICLRKYQQVRCVHIYFLFVLKFLQDNNICMISAIKVFENKLVW